MYCIPDDAVIMQCYQTMLQAQIAAAEEQLALTATIADVMMALLFPPTLNNRSSWITW
jgi:hypothetical protein